MNRGWLIKRQFKIFTWHGVKATVLCNTTDTINAVSLPWAALGTGLPPASHAWSHGGRWVGFTASTLRSLLHPGVTAKPTQNQPLQIKARVIFSNLLSLFFSFLLVCILPSLTVTAWTLCWISGHTLEWDEAEVPDPVLVLLLDLALRNANISWLWIFAVCNLKASLDNPLPRMKDCAWECDFAKYSSSYPSISSFNYVIP